MNIFTKWTDNNLLAQFIEFSAYGVLRMKYISDTMTFHGKNLPEYSARWEKGGTDYSICISISKKTKDVLNPSPRRTKFPSINKSPLLGDFIQVPFL